MKDPRRSTGRPGRAPRRRAKPLAGGPRAPGPARGGYGRRATGPRRPATDSARRRAGVKVTPAAPPVASDGRVRLNRFLSLAGVTSRRDADAMIVAGRVAVNGKVERELGQRIDPNQDEVLVDGERVQAERPVHLLFNKPSGVVCTNAPHEKHTRVIDLLPPLRGRVYTVGRLDLDAEGLILVTNDGLFAQAMTHPRYGVPKTYAALVSGRITDDTIEKARGGVWLAEGRTGRARIQLERLGRDRSYLKITVRESKHHELRRVFAKLGHPVLALKRIRIGQLTLHRLSRGQSRLLAPGEVAELMQIARNEEP
jgi:pseudouridine synthase